MQPILCVDLTTNETSQYSVPEDWERDFLGAASLASRILYEYLVPGLDPLSPQAPLLFLTGPLTGTAGPAVGRYVICARSPATGLWGESNCGGFWGPELRKAGFDGLLITGRAQKPVYLCIRDGTVAFKDAAHLWGMDTYQTRDAIQEEIGEQRLRVAVIGPAGESKIPMSLILADHGRVAGRTGMGAVMGSKNLKAVAVKGAGKIPFARSEFTHIRGAANRELKTDNFSQVFHELGSSGGAEYLDYLGEMPKKYFQSGVFEGVDKVTGATMSETILKGYTTCHACVIACGRKVQISDFGETQKGPEYETIVGFGPNLCIDDLAFITHMGDLCDRYGLDVISLSSTIGLVFKLFQEGRITTKETGGLEFCWGDKQVVESLVHQTARREGFGALLAEGSRALGRRFGTEDLVVQVNGLEVAYHDPRGASGMALTYATSPRGACHNQSDYFLVDLLGHVEERLGMSYYERHAGVEKTKNVVIHQNWRSVFNSLVMCNFANVPPVMVLDLVVAATGFEYELSDLLKIGERSWNLKRVINNNLGLTRESDRLPQPLLEPLRDGGSVGYQIPFEEMINAYYIIRGWDPVSGHPSREKLAEMGLDWVNNLA